MAWQQANPAEAAITLPTFILNQAQRVGDSFEKAVMGEGLNKYALIGMKIKLRFLHAHTRLRGNYEYNQKVKAIVAIIDSKIRDASFWKTDGHEIDRAYSFLELLMDWYELEAENYERFNLVPAEDYEEEWENVPWATK